MSPPSKPLVLSVKSVDEGVIVHIGDQIFFMGDTPRDVFAKLSESSDTRSYNWGHDEDAVEINLPQYGISFYFDPFLYRLQAVVCRTSDSVQIVWDGKELHPLEKGAATAAEVAFVVMGEREAPQQQMQGLMPPYFSHALSWFAFNCSKNRTRGGASSRRSQQLSTNSSADASGEFRRQSTEGERSQMERGSVPLHNQQPAESVYGQGRGRPVTSTHQGLVNFHNNPNAPGTAARFSASNDRKVTSSQGGNSEDDECDGLKDIDEIVFGRRRATVSVGSILHPIEEDKGSDVEEEEGEERGSEMSLSKIILFDDHLYDELRVSKKTTFFVIRYDEVGKRCLQMITADLKLEEEGAMAKVNRQSVHFEEPPRTVIEVLGEEDDSTTSALSPGESNELVKFSFFSHGIDVVFRQEKNKPHTRKVVQFILHACHAQHEDFLAYNRCLFRVDMPSMVEMKVEVEAISVFSTENDVQKIATLKPEASDAQSKLYGGQGLVFKVMDGLLATVTVEEDKNESKALDPVRLPEIPEWSAARNAEQLPIFRIPDQ